MSFDNRKYIGMDLSLLSYILVVLTMINEFHYSTFFLLYDLLKKKRWPRIFTDLKKFKIRSNPFHIVTIVYMIILRIVLLFIQELAKQVDNV